MSDSDFEFSNMSESDPKKINKSEIECNNQ